MVVSWQAIDLLVWMNENGKGVRTAREAQVTLQFLIRLWFFLGRSTLTSKILSSVFLVVIQLTENKTMKTAFFLIYKRRFPRGRFSRWRMCCSNHFPTSWGVILLQYRTLFQWRSRSRKCNGYWSCSPTVLYLNLLMDLNAFNYHWQEYRESV